MMLSVIRPRTCQTGCVGNLATRTSDPRSCRRGHSPKNVMQVTERDYIPANHLDVRGTWSVGSLLHLAEGSVRRPQDVDAFQMLMRTLDKSGASQG